MTLLDGAVLIGYIVGLAAVVGGFVGLCAAASTRLLGRWSRARFHHLVQGFIPLAACGVFLGLSMTTVSLLRSDGFDFGYVAPLRAALLGGACLWSLWLGWRIAGVYRTAHAAPGCCDGAVRCRRRGQRRGLGAAVLGILVYQVKLRLHARHPS